MQSQVGLITPDGEEYRWLLPVSMAKADPIGLGIGRFHQRHPSGNNPSDVSDDNLTNSGRFITEFLQLTDGQHLAGAVVSFDEERLRRMAWDHGFQPSWHYHLIDVEALAAGWLARRRDVADAYGDVFRLPWDSGELSRAVGVNPEDFDRHTALGDCRWAKAIYEAVLGK